MEIILNVLLYIEKLKLYTFKRTQSYTLRKAIFFSLFGQWYTVSRGGKVMDSN